MEQDLCIFRTTWNFVEPRRAKLVRIDVRFIQGHRNSCELRKRLHQFISFTNWRISVIWPASAAAAAITGLTRCVLTLGPWRPRKFRFDVDTQRCPFDNTSPLMPVHIEHPG